MKIKFTKNSMKTAWLIAIAILTGIGTVHAQFTITENFKGSNLENGIILGGSPKSAYLTSGLEDPINQGWLRVTKAMNDQKGFAYINKSFPSTLGVFVDFEYKAWRDKNDDGYNGADGFSIFLFDASYGPNGGSDGKHEFALGGYGGSLGYANYETKEGNKTVTTLGLSGGYIGIGIDEYGNFSNNTEGRNGTPVNGLKPNSIVLRGPTINDTSYSKSGKMTVTPDSKSNYYLAGIQLSPDPKKDEVDYNTTTATRPTDNQFYRRVRIEIDPTTDGKYHIIVRWTKTPNGNFTDLISYTTTTPPPPNLKIGFAASSGGGINYHEIRNVVVTTPGGVRVDKTVDKTSAAVGAKLKYTINVYNATTADITNLKLADTLKDASGHIIPAAQVRIDSVKMDNHGNNNTAIVSAANSGNIYSATLKMGAATTTTSTVATITAYATVLQYPEGGSVVNTVKLDSKNTGITDVDTTNDIASATTEIVSTDLSVTATHSDPFYQGDINKSILVKVANNGPNATGSSTTVVDTLPEGLIYTGSAGNGWITTVNGQIVTSVYNGSIASGAGFPPLTIKVDVAKDAPATVTNVATVDNSTDDNAANNTYRDLINIHPFTPGVIADNQTITGSGTPALLTEAAPPAGSIDGHYTHQWQVSTNGTDWTNIDGATGTTYQENSILYATTYYRRLDNATGREDQDPLATNVVTITVMPITLSVQLSGFSAVAAGHTSLLSWTTKSETGNKGFDIERSANGNNWSKTGFVATKAANGNSTASIDYTYTDAQPAGGANYYRLKQTDKDGNSSYSDIKIVSFDGAAGLILYPNPVSSMLYIKSGSSIKGIQMVDVAGKTVYHASAVSQSGINVSNFSAGIYFVKITLTDGTITTKQVIIKK